jgi:hypothetical protein
MNTKPLLLLAFSLVAFPADLGVVTPRHGIILNSETTRPDFKQFEADFKSSGDTNIVTLTITNVLIMPSDLVRLPSGRTVMGLRSRFADGSVSDRALYTFDLRRADPPKPSAKLAVVTAGGDDTNAPINESGVPPPPMPMGHHIGGGPIPEMITMEVDIPTGTNQMMFFRAMTETNLAELIKYADSYTVTNKASRYVISVPSEKGLAGVIDTIQEATGSNIVFVPKPLPGATNQSYAEYLDWMADRKGKRRNE